MSEIKLSDNPSIEAQVGMMANAINRLLEDTRDIKLSQTEVKEEVSQLKFFQREQNSNVAIITRRMDDHDDWHGEEDKKLVKRVHDEELREARNSGKADGVRTVLGIEYKILRWIVGSGLVGTGLFLGKIINWIGWW